MRPHNACHSLVVAGVLLASVMTCPSAARASDFRYPDLVADAPGVTYSDGTARPPRVYSDGYSSRLLLRFDGYVHNRGSGPLELRGTSPFGDLTMPMMGSVTQRVYDASGGYHDLPSAAHLQFETSDDHRHWHLKSAARYSLWNDARTAEVGASSKIGFCLADIEAVDAWAGPKRYRYTEDLDGCRQTHENDPSSGAGAQSVRMGIDSGWRDVYDAGIALQWVDVSDTPPGRYWLRSEINPEGEILESPSGRLNVPHYADVPSIVPGYLARPISRGHVPANLPSDVTLQTDSFDKATEPSVSRRFRITEQPAHGSLRPTGTISQAGWFVEPKVTYVPDPGYFGPDSFKFAARDASSFFPRTQSSAAVTMQVGTGGPSAVTITKAPATLAVGTSTQLSAVITAAPTSHVTWKVDGRVGGGGGGGSIGANGIYTAPEAVPPRGVAHVEASTDDGATDHVDIAITPRPAATPAPDVGLSVNPFGGIKSRLRIPRSMTIAQLHHSVVIKLVPPRSGTLRIDVRQGRRVVARARFAVLGRQPISRKLRLHVPYSARPDADRLTAAASLRSRDTLLRRWSTIGRRPAR